MLSPSVRRFARPLLVFLSLAAWSTGRVWAAPPTPAYALSLTPSQPGVDYARPAADAADRCSIAAEKDANSTAWVVRNPSGQILRRFADTDGDGDVDVWSYFREGVEVYRDIDSNADSKVDQQRWFHVGGARWGEDVDQDGEIDRWRSISPHEVAEEVVSALQRKDEKAFRRLLLTGKELDRLGAGTTLRQRIEQSLNKAPSAFRDTARRQKSITPRGVFADFGASRPSVIPARADGSTKDVMVYQNVSALVVEGDQTEQVQIGLLVQVGDAWRLVESPQIGDEAVALTVAASLTASTQADESPNERMQELMSALEKLDQQPRPKESKQRGQLAERRVKLLRALAAATPPGALQDQWYNQLADMLSAAVIEGDFAGASAELGRLDKDIQQGEAGPAAKAHVRFQTIWTDWAVRSQDPKADYARLQSDWRKKLEAFAKRFPASGDAAEALLQLGMADDLAGRDKDAARWYSRLAKDFDGTTRAAKATGALRRLQSPGQPLVLRGDALDSGRIDLASYRGKVVVVQYWATWCEPCKEDMQTLAKLVKQYGRKGSGFAVLGVNLDNDRSTARDFVSGARLPWRHLHEAGGLESRLANEMGVINLPLMLLVDKTGKVVSRNLLADEVEKQLQSRLR